MQPSRIQFTSVRCARAIVVAACIALTSCGGGGGTGGGNPGAGHTGSDHRLIYVSRSSNSTHEIFTAELDGSDRVQLTDDPAFECWWPRPSPDATRVLYYRSPAPGDDNDYERAALWSMNIDGSGHVELIPQGSNGWTAQGVVDWAPDGQTLVMAATHMGLWTLWITDADGSNPTQISRRDSLYADPSFSPDGSRVVYSAFPEGYVGVDLTRLEIHTMNRDGTDEVRLTNDLVRDHDPYYSPDGTEIAFEAAVGGPLGLGQWDIRVVPSTGGATDTITTFGTVPRWSHDGETIWFYTFRFPIGWIVTRVQRDGSGREELIENGFAVDTYRAR